MHAYYSYLQATYNKIIRWLHNRVMSALYMYMHLQLHCLLVIYIASYMLRHITKQASCIGRLYCFMQHDPKCLFCISALCEIFHCYFCSGLQNNISLICVSCYPLLICYSKLLGCVLALICITGLLFPFLFVEEEKPLQRKMKKQSGHARLVRH